MLRIRMKQLETVIGHIITKLPSDFQRVIFLHVHNIGARSSTLIIFQLFVFQIVGIIVFWPETPLETVGLFSITFGAVITELKLNQLKSSDMKPFPYTNAILNDAGGDIDKRWSISFWVWSVQSNDKIRRFDYSVNKYTTVHERRSYSKKRIKIIDSLLEKGYHIDTSKPKQGIDLTIKKGVNYALSVCSLSHPSKLSYSSVINIFVRWCEDRGIENRSIGVFSKKDAFDYRDKLAMDGKAGKTINSDVGCLKSMWNVLIKRELITENPWKSLDKEKEIITNKNIAYTWEEVQRLAEIIPAQDKELWHFISIIYHSLARPNEIRQLQVYNIHLSKRKIYFDAYKTKSKKERWINMHDGLIETFIDLIKNKSSNDFLFPGINDGNPVSKNMMNNRNSFFLKILELDDGDHTLYSWKHTGVIQAYESGVDIKSIQQQCGHSSVTETDNYLKSLGLYDNFEIILKQPSLPKKAPE